MLAGSFVGETADLTSQQTAHITVPIHPAAQRDNGTSALGLALENAQSHRAIRPGVGDV